MAKAPHSALPVPVLYRSVFQAKYKPRLDLFDLMYPAAKKFTEFQDWQTDRLSVILFDFNKHCSIAISHDSFSYSQDSHDSQQESSYIERIVSILPPALGLSRFVRFGLRRWYLIPVDFSFESLVAILNLKLLSQDRRVQTALLPKMDDMMYVSITSDDRNTAKTAIGPMHKNEIPRSIPFDKEHHLPADKRTESYLEVVKKYPEVCVYVEVDFFQQAENLNQADTDLFIKVAGKKVTKMIANLSKYLFSTKLEN